MQDDYSWSNAQTGTSSYKFHKSEGVAKWVLVALLFALCIHVLIIWGLSRIDVIFSHNDEEKGLETEVVRVYRVETDDSRPELPKPEVVETVDPVEIVPPADELDMLENIGDVDIDISPEIETIQVPMSEPAMKGVLDSESFDAMKSPIFEPDLPEMGMTEDFFPRSTDGQVVVDPGSRMAEEFDPDEYTDTLRQGAGGAADDGLFKEFTSLDAMARMDGNSLLASKALIGSDLLFDFNSATLRQSARLSLMKVAMLIDKHPDLVCWVDGHTDLIGGETPNLILSEKRALAVKIWLVDTLDLDGKQVAVRGFGKQQPLVLSGTAEEQAPNRRVEIKMRKRQPEDVGSEISTGKPDNKAIKEIIPQATELVEESMIEPAMEPEVEAPVAVPVAEDEPVLVFPKIPKAQAVAEIESVDTVPLTPPIPPTISSPPKAIEEIEDGLAPPSRAILIEE
ncbi:MAG: OmpA family protein [Akkermansiaceae bacterium]